MNKKTSTLHLFAILSLALLVILSACGEPPAIMTQERLDLLNCHPGDLPEDQSYKTINGHAPSLDIFIAGAPPLVSTLAYNDTTSTRQSFSCSMFVFEDEQIAQQGFESACDELRPPYDFPDISDQACQGGEQETILVFRHDNILVWIWADYNGYWIENVANRIEDRLNK